MRLERGRSGKVTKKIFRERLVFRFYPECEDDKDFINDIIRYVRTIKKLIIFLPKVKDVEIGGFTLDETKPLIVTVLVETKKTRVPVSERPDCNMMPKPQ